MLRNQPVTIMFLDSDTVLPKLGWPNQMFITISAGEGNGRGGEVFANDGWLDRE